MDIETTMRKDKPEETAIKRQNMADAETAAPRILREAREAAANVQDNADNHD